MSFNISSSLDVDCNYSFRFTASPYFMCDEPFQAIITVFIQCDTSTLKQLVGSKSCLLQGGPTLTEKLCVVSFFSLQHFMCMNVHTQKTQKTHE